MKTLLLQAFFVFPVWCLIDPLNTSNSSSELQELKLHVLQLEQNLGHLQAQSNTQEQKYAAVLQSVLSKLTSTTDELSALKTTLTSKSDELTVLKSEHNATLLELATVQSELKTTGTGLIRLKSELQSYRSNHTADFNATATKLSDLEVRFQSMSSEQQNLKDELAGINQTMSILHGDEHMTNSGKAIDNGSANVGFQATSIVDIDINKHTHVSGVLQFDHLFWNKGHGFDTTTGKFTAPVTGVYQFWVNVLTNQTDTFNLSIVKEGHTAATANDPAGKAGIIITAMLVKKREQVWCQTDKRIIMIGSLHSYYGGMLVQAMESSEMFK